MGNVPVTDGFCPPNWLLMRDKCYIRSPTELTRSACNAYCGDQYPPARLLCIRDATDNENVRAALPNNAVNAWLGANDNAVEGQWRWPNACPSTYFNWLPTEPNDTGGNENFAVLRKSDGLWNDRSAGTYTSECMCETYTISKPTVMPTPAPSAVPTPSPSGKPTFMPSPLPTSQPSAQPSRQPSSHPSRRPTGQPTRQPSSQPSAQPTRRPSAQPSKRPSRRPTTQPSSKPSSIPSPLPSSYPSSQPSAQPSSQPSIQPSVVPTVQPSSRPSSRPSSQPSKRPSSQPTMQPTLRPTARPSLQPTTQPSRQPTTQPTSQPSMQPSRQPVAQPTSQPSRQPFGDPSGQPSAQPFGKPTSQPSSAPPTVFNTQPTVPPTLRPTAVPSAPPTSAPSSQPSVQPSERPSTQPTAVPTTQPSSRPSGQPSAQPSRQPTAQPSAQPSSRPSSQPSVQPSGQPSSQPLGVPSSQPSRCPSSQPSNRPSAQPSGQPSRQPTTMPSAQPSVRPSAQPSIPPSSQPTRVPSAQPSGAPSCQPSCAPTTQPSLRPSSQPSAQPSTQPTCDPSAQPSGQPTAVPSVQPSNQPTVRPSVRPSCEPTVQPSSRPSRQPSRQPTGLPTVRPSIQPSGQPSAHPSRQPSVQPSRQPTSQPTSQPSHQPSIQPTSQPSSQPSSQPTTQPTCVPTFPLSTGEWVQWRNETSVKSVAVTATGMWLCGDDSVVRTSCAVVDKLTGTALTTYQFMWDTITSVVTTPTKVVVSGRTTANGVSTSDVAVCALKSASLAVCDVITVPSVSFLDVAYNAYAKRVVYTGMNSAYTSVTVVDTNTSTLQSYVYTATNLQPITLLYLESPVAFVGSFVAGIAVGSTTTSNSIVCGWLRTDTGQMAAAIGITPVSGSIVSTAGLVNAMALEATGPDSFIAGGLELSDGAGVHAYLVRANALFGSVSHGVRYLPRVSSTRRQLSTASVRYTSTVRGLALVEDVLFVLIGRLDSAVNRTSVSIIKTHTATGAIIKQVQVSVTSANLHCTDITYTGLLLAVTCSGQYISAPVRSLIITVDRDLSFEALPPGFTKHYNSTLYAETLSLKRTVLSVKSTRATITTTRSTYATTDATASRKPSAVPTTLPTAKPTVVRTSKPSTQPSSSPTATPSVSAHPTSHPSTAGPTKTHNPSVLPSPTPTSTPTTIPTITPTVTASSTVETMKPTPIPTTTIPSVQPSTQPTVSPTLLPTIVNTRNPTTRPTRRPVLSPVHTYVPTLQVTSDSVVEKDSSSSGSVPPFAIGASIGGAVCITICAYIVYKRNQQHHAEKERELRKADYFKRQLEQQAIQQAEETRLAEAVRQSIRQERRLSRANMSAKLTRAPPATMFHLPRVSSDSSVEVSSLHSSEVSYDESVYSNGFGSENEEGSGVSEGNYSENEFVDRVGSEVNLSYDTTSGILNDSNEESNDGNSVGAGVCDEGGVSVVSSTKFSNNGNLYAESSSQHSNNSEYCTHDSTSSVDDVYANNNGVYVANLSDTCQVVENREYSMSDQNSFCNDSGRDSYCINRECESDSSDQANSGTYL